ncbi:MAG: hypothetical protein WD688_01190 [Candidatus Binatia bacterium]
MMRKADKKGANHREVLLEASLSESYGASCELGSIIPEYVFDEQTGKTVYTSDQVAARNRSGKIVSAGLGRLL